MFILILYYIPQTTGIFKSKMYGPYKPSIGCRTYHTVRKKSEYAVEGINISVQYRLIYNNQTCCLSNKH